MDWRLVGSVFVLLAGMAGIGCTPAEEPVAIDAPTGVATATPGSSPTANLRGGDPVTSRSRGQSPIAPRGQRPAAKPAPLITGGGFEYWNAEGPAGWKGNYTTDADGSTPYVVRVSSAHSGDRAVRLHANGTRLSMWQSIRVGGKPQGKTLTCSAYIKNPVPNAMIVKLMYMHGDTKETVDAERSDEGEWTKFTIKSRLPADIDPKSISLSFTVREFVKTPVILDTVTASLLKRPVVAKKAVPVLMNAGFEDWSANGPQRWSGNYTGAPEDGKPYVVRTGGAKEGERAVRLHANGVRLGMWQSLKLGQNAAGKIVTCIGYAKNPVSDAVMMQLSYQISGEKVVVNADRADDGDWTKFTAETAVSRGTDPKSFSIAWVVREHVKAPVIVDSISVSVK